MASNVSLFPPSSKGSWGAVCVRARAENVAYIYSAAHHAAQHRCDAWGAVRASACKPRPGGRRQAPPAPIQLALAAAGTSGGATLKLIHLLGNAVSEFPCEQALAIALPQGVSPIRTPKQLNLVRFHHGSRALIQGVVECSLGKEVADFFSKFLSDNMALN